MIKEILIAISNRLKEVPQLRYIAEDWGQLDVYEVKPIQFPCALIDLQSVDYSSATKGLQIATADINIRIATTQQSTSTAAPNFTASLDVHDLITDINKKLHGFSSATFSPLCRVRIQKPTRDDVIREYIITYRVSYTDKSAISDLQKIVAKPLIKLSTKK